MLSRPGDSPDTIASVNPLIKDKKLLAQGMQVWGFELAPAERRLVMYLDKFIEASIVALGLSPGAQDRLIVSSRGVSQSTDRTSTKRHSQTLHPVAANPPPRRDEQD